MKTTLWLVLGTLACAACETPSDPIDPPDLDDAGVITPPTDAPLPTTPDAPGCSVRTEEVTVWEVDGAISAPAVAIAAGQPRAVFPIDATALRVAARDDAGAWSSHRIEPVPASDPALVVEDDDTAHVCMVGAPMGQAGPIICVDRPAAGPDTMSTVDPRPHRRPSLARDALGGLHVASVGSDGVWYAYRPAGGAWTRPEQVTDAEVREVAIAADATGAPHLVYTAIEDGGRVLVEAHRDGGAWTRTHVPADEPVITARALAADADGTLHLAYLRRGAVLTYTTRPVDGAWALARAIDPDVRVHDVALALGPGGAIAVAHVTDATRQARVSSRDPSGAWSVTPVREVATASVRLAVAIDGAGAAHVVLDDPETSGHHDRLLHATLCAPGRP